MKGESRKENRQSDLYGDELVISPRFWDYCIFKYLTHQSLKRYKKLKFSPFLDSMKETKKKKSVSVQVFGKLIVFISKFVLMNTLYIKTMSIIYNFDYISLIQQ